MTLSDRMKSIDPTDNRISTKASQYIGRLDLQQILMKEEEEVKAMKISLMSLQEEDNQSEDMH